jgi:hypothetical protein
MDIFFTDPNQVPLPPDEVRILEIVPEPYPDGRRIRLSVEITPFQKKPSGDIFITDPAGKIVAATSFIEAVTPKFEMTLHLRTPGPGDYLVKIVLFYNEDLDENGSPEAVMMPPEKKIIDEREKEFKIGP